MKSQTGFCDPVRPFTSRSKMTSTTVFHHSGPERSPNSTLLRAPPDPDLVPQPALHHPNLVLALHLLGDRRDEQLVEEQPDLVGIPLTAREDEATDGRRLVGQVGASRGNLCRALHRGHRPGPEPSIDPL